MRLRNADKSIIPQPQIFIKLKFPLRPGVAPH
jgi:hypothetical protein